MSTVVLIASLLVAAVAGVTGGAGAWLWWRMVPATRFWPAIRATQAGALALAVVAGVAWATGAHPASRLFWLYAVLPIVVSFVAEQLRIVAAEQVLERRGLSGAAEVGELDPVGQEAVVREIVRREIGVMAAAALVIAVLALRMLSERGGL